MAENGFAMLNYYFSLPDNFAMAIQEEQAREMGNIQNLLVLTRRYNLQDLNSEIDGRLQQQIQQLSGEMQQ
jgi:polyhydroxyalkanoate synthesis regulator phasin